MGMIAKMSKVSKTDILTSWIKLSRLTDLDYAVAIPTRLSYPKLPYLYKLSKLFKIYGDHFSPR